MASCHEELGQVRCARPWCAADPSSTSTTRPLLPSPALRCPPLPFPSLPSFTTKKKAVLKRRIRKGIPEALRGTVWPLLVGSDRQKEANASLYTRLLHVEYPGKAEVEETIERDISRTFPRHAMFAQQGGLGQAALERVLHAYAAYDQEVREVVRLSASDVCAAS